MNKSTQDCMYLRKSRMDMDAELSGASDTLARHERQLHALASRVGANVTWIFREIVSGETIAARPAVQSLLDGVQEGRWRSVLVMDLDRLARGNTKDQGIILEAFQLSGTKIITPLKTYDPSNEYDEEYMEFGLFMGRREYQMINRRIQRGRCQSAAEGNYIGSKPPYGYIRRKLDSQKGFSLIPHPDQAAVVQMIYRWYTCPQIPGAKASAAVGISSIVQRLNALHIPSYSGGRWSYSSVRRILSNPVYAGKIASGQRRQQKKIAQGALIRTRSWCQDYKVYDGKHPPIISQESYDAAQSILQRRSAARLAHMPSPSGRQLKNPFAGLLRCSCCGRGLIRRPYGGQRPDFLICPTPGCPTVGCPLEQVDSSLLTALQQWYSDVILPYPSVCSSSSDTLSAFRLLEHSRLQSLKQLSVKKDRLYDLLEGGIYSPEEYASRMRRLQEEERQLSLGLQALQEEIAKTSSEGSGSSASLPSAPGYCPEGLPLPSLYARLSPSEKRALLGQFFYKIEYQKQVRTSRNQRGTPSALLSLYPNILPSKPASVPILAGRRVGPFGNHRSHRLSADQGDYPRGSDGKRI